MKANQHVAMEVMEVSREDNEALMHFKQQTEPGFPVRSSGNAQTNFIMHYSLVVQQTSNQQTSNQLQLGYQKWLKF